MALNKNLLKGRAFSNILHINLANIQVVYMKRRVTTYYRPSSTVRVANSRHKIMLIS